MKRDSTTQSGGQTPEPQSHVQRSLEHEEGATSSRYSREDEQALDKKMKPQEVSSEKRHSQQDHSQKVSQMLQTKQRSQKESPFEKRCPPSCDNVIKDIHAGLRKSDKIEDDYRVGMSNFWANEFNRESIRQESTDFIENNLPSGFEKEGLKSGTNLEASISLGGQSDDIDSTTVSGNTLLDQNHCRGAYAHAGSGVQERRATLNEELRATLGGEATDEREGTTDPSSELHNPAHNFSDSLAKAKMINNAETVFLAEDVQHDNSRKLSFFAALVVVCVAVLLTTGLLAMRSRDNECSESDICCNPVEKLNVFEKCSCFNSSFSAYDELSERGLVVYENQIDLLQNTSRWTTFVSDEDSERSSCEPVNQILLHFGLQEGFGLTPDVIEAVPMDVVISVIAFTATFVELDGPHWTNNDKWGDTPVLCDWYGIGCLFVDVPHELTLPNNGLSGTIPPFLALVPELRDIDLSQNQITGTIPSEFGSMAPLRSLQLSELNLAGEIPWGLGNLSRLGILDLHLNGLSGTLPSEIFEMRALREFDGSSNMLSGSFPNTTYSASQLAILRVNNNRLTGSLPEEIQNLSSLELLNLGRNDFSGTIPEFLGRMPLLQFVNFFESGLTGSIPETFCEQSETRGRVRLIVDCQIIGQCSCCSSVGTIDALVTLECGEEIPFFTLDAEY